MYCKRGHNVWCRRPITDTAKQFLIRQPQIVPRREYGILIARALRGLLKIRYLVLGGAVGGGVTLQKVLLIDINLMLIYVCMLIIFLLEISRLERWTT